MDVPVSITYVCIRHADTKCRCELPIGGTIVQVAVPVVPVLVLSYPIVVVALEAQYCAPTPDHVSLMREFAWKHCCRRWVIAIDAGLTFHLAHQEAISHSCEVK